MSDRFLPPDASTGQPELAKGKPCYFTADYRPGSGDDDDRRALALIREAAKSGELFTHWGIWRLKAILAESHGQSQPSKS